MNDSFDKVFDMIEQVSSCMAVQLGELEAKISTKAEEAANAVITALKASGALDNKGTLTKEQCKELLAVLDRVNHFEERVDH